MTDKEISDKTIVIAKDAANLRPVKGTMKLHAVVGQGNSKIFVRDTSCYCVGCLSGVRCDDWRAEHTRKPTPTAAVTVHADIQNEIEVSVPIASESVIAGGDLEAPAPSASIGSIEEGQPELEPLIGTETSAHIGEYVAAVYENEWYVGKIVKVDAIEGEVEIKFMETKNNAYQWPKREDRIWVSNANVLCTVNSPQKTNKPKLFTFSDSDIERCSKLFEARI